MVISLALALIGFAAALSRTLIPTRLDGSVESRRPTGEWPNSAMDTWYVTLDGQTYITSPETAAALVPGAEVGKAPWSRDLTPGNLRLEIGGDLPRLAGAYLLVLMTVLVLLTHRSRRSATPVESRSYQCGCRSVPFRQPSRWT